MKSALHCNIASDNTINMLCFGKKKKNGKLDTMDPKAKEVFRHPELVEKMSKGNFDFVMELYQKCISGSEGNVFLSPDGISAALFMLFIGARGQTQDQLRTVMHLDQIGDAESIQDACEDIKLSMALSDWTGFTLFNIYGMYVHKDLQVVPDYKEFLQAKFSAFINNVDFVSSAENVRIEINSFVENITHSRICNLVPPDSITPDARFIVANAIYFKGDWLYGFDLSVTAEAKFTISKGKTKMVNMMTQTSKFRYAKIDKLKCSVVELPYVGERLRMYILLPKDIGGLAKVESKVNNDSLCKLSFSEPVLITVSLPRFKVESSFSLGDIFKSMGMQAMFTQGVADFAGITTTEPVQLSAFFHRAVLEVDEEGSEDVVEQFDEEASSGQPLIFKADHPFMVLVRDTWSGVVLFGGRITNPPDSA